MGFFLPIRSLRAACTAVAVISVFALSAQAGELVTLRNGFEMRCDHHAQAEGRVRLFPSASEDSYIEMAPDEIAGVEQVPDLPVPA
ncbi:MAG: hypothetical protein ABSD43_14415, partial [Terracidiphilus sp.]